MSGAGLIGNWARRITKLKGLGAELNTVVERFPKRMGAHLESEIKEGIVSQSPGGIAFKELAESTIRRKKSNKALIDTNAMREAVTHQDAENITGVKGAQYVGLLRTEMHRPKDGSGDEITMANLGEIHELIGVRRKIGGMIKMIKRPFIGPIWAVEKPKMKRALVDDVMKVGRW